MSGNVREAKQVLYTGCITPISYRSPSNVREAAFPGEERIVYDPDNNPWHYRCLFPSS